MYDQIDDETTTMLIDSLANGLMSGKLPLLEMKYYPIGFLNESQYDEREANTSHCFEITTLLNGLEYEISITETINLESGKGDIFGDICYDGDDGERKYDLMLSSDIMQYEDADAAELKKLYSDSSVARLAEAMATVFTDSDAAAEGFSYARFFNEKGISQKWKKNPLVKLCEKMMNEKNLMDFHRIILDTEYREKF
ncbi:MAG: hypothetical protein PHW34_13490 [Hespellia sp.]|nr:hypothetical protein [Hespellia sp.]